MQATDGPAAPATDDPPDGQQHDRVGEWIDLLADDDAPASFPHLFEDATAALQHFVTSESRAGDAIDRAIARGTATTEDEPLGSITDALVYLLGEDGTYLIHWLVYMNTRLRLDLVSPFCSPEVSHLLRTTLAFHGETLDRLQGAAFSAGPDDWARIKKQARFDTLTGHHTFWFSLTKWDGSTLQVECSPDSLVNFTNHLLELIVSTQTPTTFSDQPLARLREALAAVDDVLFRMSDDVGDVEVAGGQGIEP